MDDDWIEKMHKTKGETVYLWLLGAINVIIKCLLNEKKNEWMRN